MSQVMIRAAGLTDRGGRNTNEDAFWVCSSVEEEKLQTRGHLYVVADGTGGQEGGQTASTMAAAIVGEHYYDNSDPEVASSLRTAAETAHETLHELAKRVQTWAQMSTTLAAVVIKDGKLVIAHVGDSRVYLVRGDSIRQCTRDHIWLDEGENYGALTRYMGGQGNPHVEVETTEVDLQTGDAILLCTDGLYSVLHKEVLQEITNVQAPVQACKRLIATAKRRNTSDNATAIVARYGGKTRAGIPPLIWVMGVASLVVLAALLLTSIDGDDPVTMTPVPSATMAPLIIDDTSVPMPATEPTATWEGPSSRSIETATYAPKPTATATDTGGIPPTSTRQPTLTPTDTPRPLPTRRPATQVPADTPTPTVQPTNSGQPSAPPTSPPPTLTPPR